MIAGPTSLAEANFLINKIVESEKNDPNEFWKTIDKLKNRSSDPSSGISSHEWLTYLYPDLFFFFSGPTSLYETFKAAL
jgi:hypothetical protein